MWLQHQGIWTRANYYKMKITVHLFNLPVHCHISGVEYSPLSGQDQSYLDLTGQVLHKTKKCPKIPISNYDFHRVLTIQLIKTSPEDLWQLHKPITVVVVVARFHNCSALLAAVFANTNSCVNDEDCAVDWICLLLLQLPLTSNRSVLPFWRWLLCRSSKTRVCSTVKLAVV